MSTVISIGGWTADKTVALTTHKLQEHHPSPVSPNFKPPEATKNLTFGPLALAAAIARTATTRDDAPPAVLVALEKSALAEVELFIADGPTFELSPDLKYLADSERTSFAARVGAGVTDLYLNSLGYVWRANAACLSKSLTPHADFIYDGGNVSGHGVVLAEAHGSFALDTTANSIASMATRKYKRQVKPYISKTSPYGKIIHGYTVAFGSKPRTVGAFLSLVETEIVKPRKLPMKRMAISPDARQSTVPTTTALATHRSNFLLMGARQIVDWIDWIRGYGGLPTDRDAVLFFRLRYAGHHFLASALTIWSFMPPQWWLQDLWHDSRLWSHLGRKLLTQASQSAPSIGWFVMEETACEKFLEALSRIIRRGDAQLPEQLELPAFDPIGFGDGQEDATEGWGSPEYGYALFRDGLALVGNPIRRPPLEVRTWSPKEGFDVARE